MHFIVNILSPFLHAGTRYVTKFSPDQIKHICQLALKTIVRLQNALSAHEKLIYKVMSCVLITANW
jgi:hypothetical protein